MPKHIVSGLKYLESVELRKRGLSQKEISSQIGVDRSTISHYLNGRNISEDSIELSKAILDLSPKDFILIMRVLFGDYKEIRQIICIFNMNHYDPQIDDGCIGCGLCVDLCVVKSISLDSLKAKIDPRYCCGCLMCVENCPTNSIEKKKKKNG